MAIGGAAGGLRPARGDRAPDGKPGPRAARPSGPAVLASAPHSRCVRSGILIADRNGGIGSPRTGDFPGRPGADTGPAGGGCRPRTQLNGGLSVSGKTMDAYQDPAVAQRDLDAACGLIRGQTPPQDTIS